MLCLNFKNSYNEYLTVPLPYEAPQVSSPSLPSFHVHALQKKKGTSLQHF